MEIYQKKKHKIDISNMSLKKFLQSCTFLKNNFVLKLQLIGKPNNKKLKERIFDFYEENCEIDYISIDEFSSEDLK